MPNVRAAERSLRKLSERVVWG